MRDLIVSEIRRLADERGGTPPGREVFAKATGITATKWSGVYWARWGDALKEAGFEPNLLQGRLEPDQLITKIADLVKSVGRLPTRAEMRLQRRSDPSFPNHSTISNHFTSNAAIIEGLRDFGYARSDDLLIACLPDILPRLDTPVSGSQLDGVVYLLKSGAFYKVGRSTNIERRVREVTVALPEPVTLIHSIKTDDPAGIEAYWHRRFGDKRANGEWFRLQPADVKAFTRRNFQ